MTDFTLTETISSPNNSGRGSHKPQLIVLHIADGTYDGTKAWFAQAASQTSSHFIVGQDGRTCQCVPLERMAWCNGTDPASTNKKPSQSTVALVRELGGNANQYSISIECEGYYSKTKGELTGAQLDAVVQLIRWIRAEVQRIYGHAIPLDRAHIVGHCEITPKTRPNCPGEKFPWDELMARLAGDEQGVVYAVMKQAVALGDEDAARDYAADMQRKEPEAYWFVARKDKATGKLLT